MHFLKIAIVTLTLISTSFVSNSKPINKNNKQLITSSKPINYAQQITFDSKILGKPQVMNIYLPDDFEQSSKHHTYPVIFINDGHGMQFFHALTGIVKHLSLVERMPKSIVVSLNDTQVPEVYVNGMWSSMEKIDKYGQPKLYLRHLEEELFPFLKDNYRANDHRTIVSVSGSTLFPMSTLVRAPETFSAYLLLASSDMVGMGLEKGKTFIESITDSLSKRPNRKEYLYFADADSAFVTNGHSGFDYGPIYEKNFSQLKEKLSVFKNKDFSFDIEIFANEDHYAVFLKNILSALENMYPQNIWEPKYRDLIKQPGDAMANIDAFYHSLSAKYDFEIIPNADRWNNVNNLRFIAGMLLRNGRNEEAINVAERWSLYRPKSLPALHIWAQALEKLAFKEKAIIKYQQLITMAKEQQSTRLAEFELALVKARKQI